MSEEAIELAEMEFSDLRYPIYIFVVAIILAYDFSFFNIYPDSARYMLSALVQCEAAIIAVVVSMTFIAIQFAATSWSARVIDALKKTPEFWLLIILYITAIIYSLYVISSIKDNNADISSDVELSISLSYRLGILAFMALIPYTWTTLNLLKPHTIIEKLSKEISIESIQSLPFLDQRIEHDPMQPIMDIIIASLMKSDEGTLVEGLKSLRSQIKVIIKKIEINNDDISSNQIMFSVNIFSHFSLLGILAASKRDEYASIQIIRTVHKIGYAAANQKLNFTAKEAAKTLRDIGKKAAENDLKEATLAVVDALRDIGVKATEENLLLTIGMVTFAFEDIGVQYPEQTAFRAINAFKEIGEWAAKHKFESGCEHYAEHIVKSIQAIGAKAIEMRLDIIAWNAQIAVRGIGVAAIENGFTEIIDDAIEALEFIEEKAIEQNLKRTMIEATVSLGDIFYVSESYEKALEKFNKAMDMDSEYTPAWHKIGSTLMKMGMYEKALVSFEKYNELVPDSSTGLKSKGNALKALGRHAEAEAAFSRAKELDESMRKFLERTEWDDGQPEKQKSASMYVFSSSE